MMIFHCDFSTGNACAKIILENCVVTQELKNSLMRAAAVEEGDKGN